MEKETSYVIHLTEEPNSFEFGKAGNRFKLFFKQPKDLKAKIDELNQLGFACDYGDVPL